MAQPAVQIVGGAELRRALRDVDAALPRVLQRTNRWAAQKIADLDRSALSGGRGAASLVAPTVRAVAGVASSRVVEGGADTPFAHGIEFGGRKRPTTMQFEEHKRGGYYLWPAVRRTIPELVARYQADIDALINKTFK